ncbi:MAG: MarR family transcriptional regulator [Bacillota bacterium]|nr:MarR family transcriptional regulator [Bacillota bacterium]
MEKNMLSRSKKMNLSISEINMLEVINRKPIEGRLIGEIASELYITPSSVTIAINKLEKKGYVTRKRGSTDARCVYVQLTDLGKRADRIHKRFHKSMAMSVSSGLTDDEKSILLKCMRKMNDFLENKVKMMEAVR